MSARNVTVSARSHGRPSGLRPLLLIASILLPALLLSGCSTFDNIGFYWNVWRASRAGNDYYENHEGGAREIAYTDISDVRLDVYSPDDQTEGAAADADNADGTADGYPVFLFIHGGGWDKYDKKTFAPVAMRLVPREMVVVIPDYSLHPDAGYEQMSRELAAAVAWTRNEIDAYGGDPDRIVLAGHSAGGHLSGLLAFDERWLGELGHSPAELCGWIGLSGVYDIDAQIAFERSTGGEAPVMTAVMGGEANFPAASPISYITSNTAPLAADNAEAAAPGEITLIHGARDTTVPLGITQEFAAQLRRAGLEPDVLVYSESGHSDFLFEGLSDPDARVLEDIARAVTGCP